MLDTAAMLELAVGAVVSFVLLVSCGVTGLFLFELWTSRPSGRVLRCGGLFCLVAIVSLCLGPLHFEQVLALLGGFVIFWILMLVLTEVRVVIRSRAARARLRVYRRGTAQVGLPDPGGDLQSRPRHTPKRLRWRPGYPTVGLVYKRY